MWLQRAHETQRLEKEVHHPPRCKSSKASFQSKTLIGGASMFFSLKRLGPQLFLPVVGTQWVGPETILVNYHSVKMQERWHVRERGGKEKKDDVRTGVKSLAKRIGLMESASHCFLLFLPMLLSCRWEVLLSCQENFTFYLFCCFFSIDRYKSGVFPPSFYCILMSFRWTLPCT